MACHSHLKSSSLSFSSYFHLGDHRQHHFLFLGISSFIASKIFFWIFQKKKFWEREGEWKIYSLWLEGRFRTGVNLLFIVLFNWKTFFFMLLSFKTIFQWKSLHFISFPEICDLFARNTFVTDSFMHSFQKFWMHLLKIFFPKIIKIH